MHMTHDTELGFVHIRIVCVLYVWLTCLGYVKFILFACVCFHAGGLPWPLQLPKGKEPSAWFKCLPQREQEDTCDWAAGVVYIYM